MYRKTSKCLLNESKPKPKHFNHLYLLNVLVFSDSHSHLLISITQLDKWLPLQALQKTTLLVIRQVWPKESFNRKSPPAVGPFAWALEDEH